MQFLPFVLLSVLWLPRISLLNLLLCLALIWKTFLIISSCFSAISSLDIAIMNILYLLIFMVLGYSGIFKDVLLYFLIVFLEDFEIAPPPHHLALRVIQICEPDHRAYFVSSKCVLLLEPVCIIIFFLLISHE